MGNCCHPFGLTKTVSSKKQRKNIVLLLVGLDNAGKTTAAKNLIGEPLDTVVPTVGFSSVSLTHRGFSVTIYDLGGGAQIRGIWHRYFVDVHGIIFVVDASDVPRLDEGRKVLEDLLVHDKLAGKPMLLLANKQDHEGALDELDIVDQLNLETLVNQQRCPTLVEMCAATAVKNSRQKVDPAIQNGFRWLMNCIIRDYKNLNSRVEEDMAVQRKQDEQEKKERFERICKAREERGEDMGSGVTANGVCNGGLHDDSESDVIMSDPFKPIANIVDLTKDSSAPLNNKIILVKESPKNVAQPDNEGKPAEDGDNNKVKGFLDIDGDEVILVASAESRESSVFGAGDIKNTVGHLKSPTHSITEVVKGQLELEMIQHKKYPLLHRMNRTAPAPLGPPSSSVQNSEGEPQSNIRKDNLQQGKLGPLILKKQAFVEEISVSKDSQDSVVDQNKKQFLDKRSLFRIRRGSTNSEHLENSNSHTGKHISTHETNSADGRNKQRPHIGKFNIKNSKVQPVSNETSLSSTSPTRNLQESHESDQITVIRQFSDSSSNLLTSCKSSKEIDDQVLDNSKKERVIDTNFTIEDSSKNYQKLFDTSSSAKSTSRGNSRESSANYGESKLKKQQSVDETSSCSSKSQAGSHPLSDSGFISPKNILPPIRPTSSVDKPPWILSPLSTQRKDSSKDSILEFYSPSRNGETETKPHLIQDFKPQSIQETENDKVKRA